MSAYCQNCKKPTTDFYPIYGTVRSLYYCKECYDEFSRRMSANHRILIGEETANINIFNYRDLLTRYIKHVQSCEGCMYLLDYHFKQSEYDDIKFSEEEIKELRRLVDYYYDEQRK